MYEEWITTKSDKADTDPSAWEDLHIYACCCIVFNSKTRINGKSIDLLNYNIPIHKISFTN